MRRRLHEMKLLFLGSLIGAIVTAAFAHCDTSERAMQVHAVLDSGSQTDGTTPQESRVSVRRKQPQAEVRKQLHPWQGKLTIEEPPLRQRILKRLRYWEEDGMVFESHQHDDDGLNTNGYLTMDDDTGGWNNVRMALEMAVIMAYMTNRTLVLPPPSPVYLLGGTTVDVINVSALGAGIRVMTTAQFIARERRTLNIPTRFSENTLWMADDAARKAWSAWRSGLNVDLPWGGHPGYLAWPSTAAVSAAVRSADHLQAAEFRKAIFNRKPFEYTASLKARSVLNLPNDKTANLSYRYLGQVSMPRVEKSPISHISLRAYGACVFFA